MHIDLQAVPGLKDAERSLIRKHCALSGVIVRSVSIRSFLIKQIHKKRSNFKGGRFTPRDPKINKLYSKVLFGGKKVLSSFDDSFPSKFKCCLDDHLLRSVKHELDPVLGFSLCDVYYNPERVPVEELQTGMHFNTAEWELSDLGSDQATLLRFRDEFICAMQHLVDAAKQLGHKANVVAKLQGEITRYCRASEA